LLGVGHTGNIVLIRLVAFACPVARLATAVAIALVVPSAAALGPRSCEGIICKSFMFLLPLPLLTTCTPVFQALGLLNCTIDEDVGVEDEATVARRD